MKIFNVRNGIICVVALLFSTQLFCQIKFEGASNDTLPSSINELYKLLKTTPTNVKFAEEKLQPAMASFYDDVIASFFDRPSMIKSLTEREIDIRIQYQTLYNIDKNIDNIPVDSIFAMPAHYFYNNYWHEKISDTKYLSNRYVVGYIITGNHYPILDICLTNSNLFAYIIPFLYFDQEKGKIVQNFILRHQKAP